MAQAVDQIEPVAVVGMGCRFPGGANSPQAFWNLLRRGVDTVVDIPPERWDVDALYDEGPKPVPGKFYVSTGAFLKTDEIETFDADFFRMASREAAHLDPQQRLLLEVSWEALENAGIAPTSLEESHTGVFVGIHWDDYSAERFYVTDPKEVNAYATLSNLRNLSAGRISYLLNLNGPSMHVDTACSSSLLGVHLACQSLRNRECNLAIAGGVSLLLSPRLTIGFCQMRVLARDGRCKTFSASADGFAQGEGCGITILKRLSDAVNDGDRIDAVLCGSSVNHDGRSLTLTTPSTTAQQAMLKEAFRRAGIGASDVQYIETHGTGTSLGDLIEVSSLAKVVDKDRDIPLYIGSVKTNIGHLGAAAGISGLIKVILSLQNDTIPPNLHFDRPNPRLPWHKASFSVPIELTPWPETSRKLAGVSAFGMSGTNVHVVVQKAPAPLTNEVGDQLPSLAPCLLTLSSKSEISLTRMVERYLSFLTKQEPTASFPDVCYTAATGRDHFEHRLAVAANSLAGCARQLEVFLQKGKARGLVHGAGGASSAGKRAFLFAGQGSQRIGMGRELYRTQPVFRQALDRCDKLLSPYLQRSLLTILYPDGQGGATVDEAIHQTGSTQPALFALEYALAELWMSWGVRPDAVMGHSVGEYVAACIAGVFSLEDALKLITARGYLMEQFAVRGGSMVSAMATETLVESLIAPYLQDISIAALNGIQSVVISGDSTVMSMVVEKLHEKNIKTHLLRVSHAFHSPHVDPVLEPFSQVARQVTYHPPAIPFISNVTGQLATENVTDPEYWIEHIRRPVRFADSVRSLQTMEMTEIVEVGPSSTLLGMVASCLKGEDLQRLTLLPSLHSDNEWATMCASVSRLYARGLDVDWQGFYQGRRHHKVALPTYPFSRERQWIHVKQVQAMSRGRKTLSHPLLQQRIYSSALANGEIQFESTLSAADLFYVADHIVFEKVMFPASGYLEMALASAGKLFQGQSLTLEDVAIERPLQVDEPQTVQLLLSPEEDCYGWQIFGLEFVGDEPAWQRLVTGKVRETASICSGQTQIDLSGLQEELSSADVESFYEEVASMGIAYGPGLRCVRKLWRGHRQALGHIRLDKHTLDSAYSCHPAIMDGCFHLLLAALPEDFQYMYLPVGYERVAFWRYPETSIFGYVRLHGEPGDALLNADLLLIADDGRVCGEVSGCKLRKTRSQALMQRTLWPDWLYKVRWQYTEVTESAPGAPGENPWLILADRTGVGESLDELLVQKGQRVTLVYRSDVADVMTHAGWEELFARQTYRGIVYLWGLDSTPSTSYCGELLLAIQELSKTHLVTRLWLVTRGVYKMESTDTPIACWQAPLWGVGKALMLEHPEFSTTCVDLAPVASIEQNAQWLCLEVLRQSPSSENQIAYRRGLRYVPRLTSHELMESIANSPCQLQMGNYGVLSQLRFAPKELPPLPPRSIEVNVRASGLNFRDVLRALGMMRDIEDPDRKLDAVNVLFGYECAGVVERVGEQVSKFECGDAVVCYTTNSLSNIIQVSEERAGHKPTHLSFSEAATIPVAFMTAFWGLVRCAGLSSKDRILIHNAAGGVGQAAVRIAQQMGAEIFATASSGKWGFLRSLGIEHIYNSRTLEFANDILSNTGGQGVDVVLNSLNGEFVDRSVEVLSDGGRFIEIGKLLVWDAEKFRTVRPDASFHMFDLGSMEDATISGLFADVLTLFQERRVAPLPVNEFPTTEIVDAFRYMQQARHVGKVALTFPFHRHLIRKGASYLVTGGLGGLGLSIAQWLAEHGADFLILTGRRAPTGEAIERIKALEKTGVRVMVCQADVSDEQAMRDVVEQCKNLRGVVHAAGVLADNLFLQQTVEDFDRVMMPKVQGTWNLHNVTRDNDLDFFVCFSSVASLIGSPGQSNYCAANAFMDAFAYYRHTQNLPALSVNWGPWGEAGMAYQLASSLEAQGYNLIPIRAGLEALAHLIRTQDSPQLGVLRMNWPKFLGRFRATNPFLEEIRAANAELKPELDLITSLEECLAAERRMVLLDHIFSLVRRVIGLQHTTRISERQSLFDLGLDSLMAVELRNLLEGSVRQPLRPTLLFDYPTADALVDYLFEEMKLGKDLVEHDRHNDIEDSSGELSEAEIDVLLVNGLEELNKALEDA